MKLPKVPTSRRVVQWSAALIMAGVGVQYSWWVSAHLQGRWPSVSRPVGVDAFLPIDGMLGFRHWVVSGVVDTVHPAALAIFVAICTMSLLVAKSFCSHLCPIGLLSELLGRLGIRMTGRSLTPPGWLDLPLRGLKFLILVFFVWAVWWVMSPASVASFLDSPYARVADAKLWLFFAQPTRVTVAVLGIVVVASVFIRDMWCRYLCPYGALVGLLGRLAAFKVSRNPSLCTDCRACTRVCPARLPVHRLQRVASIECSTCQDCVVACPVSGCLAVRAPSPVPWRPQKEPIAGVVIAVVAFALVIAGFRLAGHWTPGVSEREYHQRLGNIWSPLDSHAGGNPVDQRGRGHSASTELNDTMRR